MDRNYPVWGIKNKKREEKKAQSLKAMLGDIQQFNGCVIGFPEGGEKIGQKKE